MIPHFTAEAALARPRPYQAAAVVAPDRSDAIVPAQEQLAPARACTCPCCIVHDCYWGTWVCTECC
jgi:hypothetical protein